MKKSLLIVSAIAALTLAFTACSNSSSGSGTSDAETDDTTTTTTTTTLFEGSQTLSWSGTNNFNVSLEMPTVSEGDKIVVTSTIDDSSYTNIALITYDADWAWVNLDGFVGTDGTSYASVDEDGSYTYTLTADDATNIAVQNALAIQAANITVTKVELVQ